MRREPGRCAIRVAEHLRALGLDVYAEQISIAEGYWRSSPHVDVYRWDVHCKAGTYGAFSPDMPISVVCWDRLTDCARYGIRLTQDGGPTALEAHAKSNVRE